MKRILIVHNYYQIPGGEDSVVQNEKKMLEKYGHEVFLYTRNNIEINEMSLGRKLLLPLTTLYNPRTAVDIRRTIKEKKIDIVHVHNTLNLISPAVYYSALSCGIPVVQTIHNFRLLCPGATFYRDGKICEECVYKGLGAAIKYACYRKSRAQTLVCVLSDLFSRATGIYGKINYICLTEFNKRKLLELKQISQNRVFVKPNFVDNSYNFVPEEKRLNQFIYAGRLDKLKGVELLLKVWKAMGKTAPKLIICGIGPMEEWCRDFVKNNLVNVEIKGFVENEEIRSLIAHSKALVLPTQWYEGFPMSIVEAYSVGTPIVCSNIGNVDSIVVEGVTGCKFEYNSVPDFINAIQRCNGLCEKTIEVYKRKYTEEVNYYMLNDIYDSIAN